MTPTAQEAVRMLPRTNAPYDPVYHSEITEPWRGLLAQFLKFCEQVSIPSKDEGTTKLILWESQRYFIEEVFAGF